MNTSLWKFFFFIAISLVLIICIFQLSKNPQPVQTLKTIPFEFVAYDIENETTVKTILFWHKMFGVKEDFYLGLGNKIFAPCPYSNCMTSFNKSDRPIDKWDAIIFHGVEYTPTKLGLPAVRSPHQRYIMYDLESPVYTPATIFNNLSNFFNWTMTYRADSDIYNPYGTIIAEKQNYTPPTLAEVMSKQKKVAWFVSRCSSQSKRESIVDIMKKYIQVDIYGKCGTMQCPRSQENECYSKLETDYKFYLSFENSVCEQYVTEKLFRILKRNVVPIVYGGAKYSKIFPPYSVINVEDFSTIRHLTDYLNFLDANPYEYLKYFEWKKNYRIEANLKRGICNLCRALHENTEKKVYENMAKWWRRFNETPACNSDFYNNVVKNSET